MSSLCQHQMFTLKNSWTIQLAHLVLQTIQIDIMLITTNQSERGDCSKKQQVPTRSQNRESRVPLRHDWQGRRRTIFLLHMDVYLWIKNGLWGKHKSGAAVDCECLVWSSVSCQI